MKKLILFVAIISLPFVILAQNYDPHDLLRVRASIDNGKHDQAIQICNEFLAKSSDYRFLLTRAEAFIGSGELKNAVSDFDNT